MGHTRYAMGINSRRQLFDCLAHRVAELVQILSFQSSAEGETDVGEHLPKFDVIRLIGHFVLELFQPGDYQQRKRGKPTLIIARRMLAEPKTALAGVILETSFARFKASITTFNAETVPSCSLGCWVVCSIAETRSDCERIVSVEVVKETTSPD